MKKILVLILGILMCCACSCMEHEEVQPLRIAVVCDLTSSAGMDAGAIEQFMFDQTFSLFTSQLPYQSHIAVFAVGPERRARPLYDYRFDKVKVVTQNSKRNYNQGSKKVIRKTLSGQLKDRLVFELGDEQKIEGRSCIDNTILRALEFLYSTSSEGLPPIKRLVVISDFLEQCDHSEIANGEFWLWSNDASRMVHLDTARARLSNWEPERNYEDLGVALCVLDNDKGQLPFKQRDLENYWIAFFTHQGVPEDSIHPDFGIPAHFKAY